ncbi:MAG: RIP metalloprotease RseP [Bacteroidia bacterium]
MGTVVMISQLILALAILITFHEWGHFQTARWFGIRVDKFYLFFDAWGKKLFKFKKGDTEYGIGWLPLGGYVKIAGMIDESMDKEFLDKEPEPWEFRSKPAWQRLIVMIGGVTVNIVLGVLIYTGIKFVYGESYHPMESIEHGIVAYDLGQELGFETGDNVISVNGIKPEKFEDLTNPDVLLNEGVYEVERGGDVITITLPEDLAENLRDNPIFGIRTLLQVDTVIAGSSAEKAGMQKGDIITKVADSTIRFFHEIVPFLGRRKGQEVPMVVNRNGNEKTLMVAIGAKGTDNAGKIGFAPKSNVEYEKFGLGQSFVRGFESSFSLLMVNIKALGKVVTGKVNPVKTVSGPIGIATMFGENWVWLRFWSLTGALSMILAFMNILPIPALDGGHVFFLLIEMIRGKALSDKALERAQIVGFVILLTLMVLIFGNDIYQLFQ